MLLWHTLATYFRRKYGVRVQKIPLDAGATCPNRDGTLSARGCIFCNDSGSGSGMGLRGLDLRAQWDAWYAKYTTTDSDRLFMAYLQSFSNTYGPASRLARLLEQVAALPGCRGIAVGTRPDCLDDEKLALLAGCGLDEVWLEPPDLPGRYPAPHQPRPHGTSGRRGRARRPGCRAAGLRAPHGRAAR